jgi:hypothetical protein
MFDKRITKEFWKEVSNEESSAANLRNIREGEERHVALNCWVLQIEAQHQTLRVTGIRKQSRLYSECRPKIHSKKKKKE